MGGCVVMPIDTYPIFPLDYIGRLPLGLKEEEEK